MRQRRIHRHYVAPKIVFSATNSLGPHPFGQAPLKTEEISVFWQNMYVEVYMMLLLAEANLCPASLVILDRVRVSASSIYFR